MHHDDEEARARQCAKTTAVILRPRSTTRNIVIAAQEAGADGADSHYDPFNEWAM